MGKQWSQIRSPFSFALTTNPHTYHAKSTADGGVLGGRSNGSLLGIDSVVNWSSYFYEQGFDSFGKIPVHLAIHHGRPSSLRHR